MRFADLTVGKTGQLFWFVEPQSRKLGTPWPCSGPLVNKLVGPEVPLPNRLACSKPAATFDLFTKYVKNYVHITYVLIHPIS